MKFAALLAVAVSAANLQNKEVFEETVEVINVEGDYFEEIDLLPDAEVAVAMVQGTGRDHTDWSWAWEHFEAEQEKKDAEEDVIIAEEGLAGAVVEYEDVLSQILSPQLEFQRNCQLHREEEINLYYQCTQNDINNYALHHFGGQVRSYPRWVEEYNVCIDHIHSAKVLFLDYHWPDGHVSLEPCDPQDHSNSVYIAQEQMIGLAWNQEVTIITAEPLHHLEPCDQQHIPNWGGIWVETKGHSDREAQDILMGNIVLDDSYTMRCYSIQKTEHMNQARMVETWDEPGERTYDVTLRPDNRFVPNGCMVHTALHGTNFTQWISGVGGESMNLQIQEEWHVTDGAGNETFDQTHQEVRVGSCTTSPDGTFTASKHFIPGVRVY